MNTLPLFPHEDNPILRKCSKCPNSYPATDKFFPKKSSNKKDGLDSRCKSCVKEYNDSRKEYYKQYREDNKAAISNRGKKYYQDNKDEIRKHQIQYEQANMDKILSRRERYKVTRKDIETERGKLRRRKKEYQLYQKMYRSLHRKENIEYYKQYRNDNSEELNEKKRQYAKTPKGRMLDLAHKHKRRAQKRASGGSCTPEQIQDQLKRQKSKCYWCHGKFEKKEGRHIYHIDHIVPLSKGGSNDISNIVLACPTCNLRKNDKLPHEWPDGGRLC